MAEGAPRDHVVSVRLTGEESAYLDQLCEVRGQDRSTVLRDLITSAQLLSVRYVVDVTPDPMLAACLCDLIDVSTPRGPEFVRGRSNGCLRHPSKWDEAVAAARRKARE